MNENAARIGGLSPQEMVRRLEREGLSCLHGHLRVGDWQEPQATRGGRRGREMQTGGSSGPLAPPMPTSDWRRFSVTLFDLEATEVRRVNAAGTGKGVNGPLDPDDRLRRIVIRAAARALYVLGLDDGQVVVATDGGGRPAVAELSPAMRPVTAEGRRRTHLAINVHKERLREEAASGVDVMLGADPEFVLTDIRGRVVPASRFLPPHGSAGSDSVVRRGIRVWPLAELRPVPAAEPAEVVSTLRRLLAASSRRFGREPLLWRAGAWPVRGLPLGGHVHISGAALTGERLRALDNAVALPLRLLEPEGAAERRPRYGALGDFRRQPHGGFEYRTPPSWLVSPRLAQGVLALAKLAAVFSRELAAARPLDDDALRDAFYGSGEAGEALLREAALRFYESLCRTEGYRAYASDVDFVFGAVREGRHWDESADIRPKWGIKVN